MRGFWDREEKPYVIALLLTPILWMIYALFSGRYFPDPGKVLMIDSGVWACVFIVAVLCMSPATKYLRLRFLSRYRRIVGLLAFSYALFHLLVYLVLFAGLSVEWIVSDLLEKPYIYAGVSSLLILIALAITSTKKMMKRLGKNWKKLHQCVYIAAACVVAHLWWQVRSDITIALAVSAFIVPLLLLRIWQSPTFQKYFK
ncbi:sulfoxide reductase heme-binding subunit YedZ [Marinomonas sp. C2222]|uniref:Protein-methionine-sulfoxide reductase heme-binding subunit MsrQ n=1 Tax=Marinomonas sargassi TaxID=2984494 RepID=A0ABT2YMY2_9GAMM|nr:protein-methionine-sulfoxide reductase heme-binding subunit MsrQ [Marinomonas sargassi]MCV2401254.1 sulfoxide reductase heme-binding subunit YedZ [Marinomonas sargassi]